MEAVINVAQAATEQEMEDAEKEYMRQEMLGDVYHEEQMSTDTHYFCEYVIENLRIPTENKKYIDIDDVLYALDKECNKYDYNIEVFLDYMKEI